MPTVAERVLARTTAGPGECLVWTGKLDRYGYGVIRVDGRYTGPHRALWIAVNGEIPPGLVVDHLCRVRHCVNLDHLEVVTSQENIRRGEGPGRPRQNVPGGACSKGHELTEKSSSWRVTRDGYRRLVCLPCERKRFADWKRRRDMAQGVPHLREALPPPVPPA